MKSVLLVDDDSNTLLAYGVRLRSLGYTVYAAKDAASAMSTVAKNKPDVVVTDISLRAGDGFVVADRLQQLAGAAAMPIIFMTGSEDPAWRERAMQMGASAFLIKPVDATALADAIEAAGAPVRA